VHCIPQPVDVLLPASAHPDMVDITRILPQPMDAGAVGMWAGPNVFSALTLLLHHPLNE